MKLVNNTNMIIRVVVKMATTEEATIDTDLDVGEWTIIPNEDVIFIKEYGV